METISREIPDGPECGGCRLHDAQTCLVFEEPYTSRKNEFCYNNYHLGKVHQAWKADGRTWGQ